jgi:hypothetical protein
MIKKVIAIGNLCIVPNFVIPALYLQCEPPEWRIRLCGLLRVLAHDAVVLEVTVDPLAPRDVIALNRLKLGVAGAPHTRTHTKPSREGEGGGEGHVLAGALSIAFVAGLVDVEPFRVETVWK